MAKNETTNQVIETVAKVIKDATGWSTDLARDAAKTIVSANPAISGLILKSGASVVSAIKSGALTKFVLNFAQAKSAGASVKAALETAVSKTNIGVSARGFTQAGAVGKTGTILGGAVKTLGLIAAMQVAKATVDTAKDLYKTKTAAFKANPNFKTGWELFWETSIPVATFRWIESAIKKKDIHAVPSDTKKADNAKGVANNTEEVSREVVDYDQTAKEMGMVDRPTHPIAEREWQKEVERNMAKRNFKRSQGSNDPAFYMRGNAKTLSAGTLTWTSVKTNDREGLQAFASVVLINTVLNIPTVRKGTNSNEIHPRIKEQINIMVQGLRGKNTGAYQYNEEDVYNYVIEMASLIARFREVKRNLSMLNKTNAYVSHEGKNMFNAYYNSASAYDSAIPFRPNYVSRINALANVINTFAVPNISLISKWNYNAEKVFTDYSGNKPIIGIFKAADYPVVDSTTGKVTAGISTVTTIDAQIAALESEVATLSLIPSNLTTNPGVFLKISADFIKLLGANKATFDNVPYASITDLVECKFDKACLDQLRNAMVVGKGAATQTFASYDGTVPFVIVNSTKVCSNGSLSPYSGDNVPGCYSSGGKFTPWLMTYDNTDKEKSAAENIEMIQYTFTSAWAYSTGTVVRFMMDSPAAVIKNMVVHYFEPQTNTMNAYLLYGWHSINDESSDVFFGLYELQANRQIDFLPSHIVVRTSTNDVRIAGLENDVDNYTYMNDNQFFNMNNVATYSLFYLYTPEELNIKGMVDVY